MMEKTPRRPKLVKLFEDQSGLCAYCVEPMTLDLGFDKTAEIEHVVPTSQGGERKWRNEVAACHECNQNKGDTPLLVWLATRDL